MGIGKVSTSCQLLFKHFIELSAMVSYGHSEKSLVFQYLAGMIFKNSLFLTTPRKYVIRSTNSC